MVLIFLGIRIETLMLQIVKDWAITFLAVLEQKKAVNNAILDLFGCFPPEKLYSSKQRPASQRSISIRSMMPKLVHTSHDCFVDISKQKRPPSFAFLQSSSL